MGPEQPESERRLRRSLDPQGNPWPAGATGICLSGGGIRSASFGLGVLQSLHDTRPDGSPSIFDSAAYLATVSGGGYTGTAAQVLAHQHPDGDPPLLAGSKEADLVRRGRRYLWGAPEEHRRWQSTREFVSGASLLVGGIVFNAVLVLVCVYVVSHPLGWFVRSIVFAGGGVAHDPSRGVNLGLTVGLALAVVPLLVVLWPFVTRTGALRSVGRSVLAVVKVALAMTASWSSSPTTSRDGPGWRCPSPRPWGW